MKEKQELVCIGWDSTPSIHCPPLIPDRTAEVTKVKQNNIVLLILGDFLAFSFQIENISFPVNSGSQFSGIC